VGEIEETNFCFYKLGIVNDELRKPAKRNRNEFKKGIKYNTGMAFKDICNRCFMGQSFI
jgi:hypothetical protein